MDAAANGASAASAARVARTKAGERQRMRSSASRKGELVRLCGQLERVGRAQYRRRRRDCRGIARTACLASIADAGPCVVARQLGHAARER